MDISFGNITDIKDLVSVLCIWGICYLLSSMEGTEMVIFYIISVSFLVVIAGIPGNPVVTITAVICICLIITGLSRSIYNPSATLINDEAILKIIQQTDSLQGYIFSDSRFINGSKQELHITAVNFLSSKKELTFSSQSRVTVILYNSNRFFKGESVELKGKFVLFEQGTLIFYSSEIHLIQGESVINIKATALRKSCIEYVYRKLSGLPYEVSELSAALLLGRKEDTSNPIIKLFRQAGCAHILALSGMHLQVISGIIAWLLSRIMRRKLSIKITSACVMIFVWITGGKPSLIRSMIMFIILSNRRYQDHLNPNFLLTALSYTIALQFLLFPATCSGPGYYLSYSAIFGILALSGRIAILLPGFIPNAVRSLLSASLAAFTVSSPFLVHYFGEIYPIGILASIPITLLVTCYMVSSMIILLPFPSIDFFRIFQQLLTAQFKFIEYVTRFFSRTPVLRIEENTIFSAFSVSSGFMLLTVFISIEYSIYKIRSLSDRSVAGDSYQLNKQ